MTMQYFRSKQLLFSLAIMLMASLVVNWIMTAHAWRKAESLQKTIQKSDIVVEQAEKLIDEARSVKWRAVPEHVKPISLKELLEKTEKNHWRLQLSSENSHARDETLQRALAEAIQLYARLIELRTSEYLAFRALEAQEKTLIEDKEQFKNGDITSIEVLQTETEMLKQHQQLEEAGWAYQQASQALALHAGLSPDMLYYPDALVFKEDRFSLHLPNPITTNDLTLNETTQTALRNRPDLKKLETQRDELKISFLGLGSITPTGSSKLKDIEVSIRQLKTTIEAAARSGISELAWRDNQLQSSQAALQLSEKALRQAEISYESGFSSQKDVMEVALLHTRQQTDYIKALVERYLSQVRLLQTEGLLSAETALQALPGASKPKSKTVNIP